MGLVEYRIIEPDIRLAISIETLGSTYGIITTK